MIPRRLAVFIHAARLAAALCLLGAAPADAHAEAGAATALPEVRLAIAGNTLLAEIASEPDQRELGLMYRRMLPENRGMLFVFERPEVIGMWMKNTYLPLSVAFIDVDGTIVNISNMQPLTLAVHYAARPVRFALETNAGWFRRHGLRPGMHIDGLPGAAPTPAVKSPAK